MHFADADVGEGARGFRIRRVSTPFQMDGEFKVSSGVQLVPGSRIENIIKETVILIPPFQEQVF